MSKKSWPILYSKLAYKRGPDFLDIQLRAYTITESQSLRSIFGEEPVDVEYPVLGMHYCLSKKSWPILHSKLQNKMGQNFLSRYPVKP